MGFECVDTDPTHRRLSTTPDECTQLVVFQNSKSLMMHLFGAGVHPHCEGKPSELAKMLTRLKPALTTFSPLNGQGEKFVHVEDFDGRAVGVTW